MSGETESESAIGRVVEAKMFGQSLPHLPSESSLHGIQESTQRCVES